MNNPERMLYQGNDLGYSLLIGFVALNTFYTVFILNVMDKDPRLGGFVMLTIFLLLLGFLMAIKVRTYSVLWSYLAIIIGVFQGTRILFTVNNVEGLFSLVLDVALITSAVLSVVGGIISLQKAKIRRNLK